MKPGPLFEAQLVAYAREHGFPHARRLVMGGANDEGDISLGDNILWVIEAKNEKVRDVPGALREARKEADTASLRRGLMMKHMAVHKYRNHSIAESIVSIPFWLFLEMLMNDDRRNVRVDAGGDAMTQDREPQPGDGPDYHAHVVVWDDHPCGGVYAVGCTCGNPDCFALQNLSSARSDESFEEPSDG